MRHLRLIRFLGALTLAAATVGACGDDGPDDYTLEVEQRFVGQCDDRAPASECRCLFGKIRETIPFDRFVELDEQREADPTFVPPELEELAVACAAAEFDNG